MRQFQLVRDKDLSGVSGTGVVAEGVQFRDGHVAVRWVVGNNRSTVVWDDIEGVKSVHGHGGLTRIVWLDEENDFAARYFDDALERGEPVTIIPGITRRERWVHLIEEWENTPSTDPDTDADDLAIMCIQLADQEMAQQRDVDQGRAERLLAQAREERDDALAEIEYLSDVIKRLDVDVVSWISRATEAEAEIGKLVNTTEDDEYLATVERQRARAVATIERVKALVASWITIKDDQETHSDKCHTWHPDCLVSAIRAAFDEATT